MTRLPCTRRTLRVMLPLLCAALPIAFGACGGAAREAPKTPIAVEPVESTDTHGTAVAMLEDLPPPSEPKPIVAASVFAIPTKVPIKAIGIASKTLPIVYCRIVVRAGSSESVIMGAADKSRAGIADLTAELLKDGGAGRFSPSEIDVRIDQLGADLTIDVSLDRAVFGIAVTKDKLDDALELLSAVVLHPHFDAAEFGKLKARTLDRVRQAQKSDGGWMARMALYRDVFPPGHPYAEVDATQQSLDRTTLADVKEFYRRAYVTGNSFVVVAGDVDPVELGQKLDHHLKGFSTEAPPQLSFPAPAIAGGRHIVLATKVGAKQADILVAQLSLPRTDAKWPDLALAVQALGGGMSARLFRDVREKRSLAYSTSASLRELASGPSMFALYAGTETLSAPLSVDALLQNLDAISAGKPIGDDELGIARVSLETGFTYRLETIGSVAGLAVDKEVLGLPGTDVYDYVAQYRKALHEAPLDVIRSVAAERMKSTGVVIVVGGDPALAKPLSHFASVRVVDPEQGFATVNTLPMDASASLDVVLTGTVAATPAASSSAAAPKSSGSTSGTK